MATAIDCLKELSQLVGPIILEHYVPDLTQTLKTLLEGRGACQVNQDDDGDDADMDIKIYEATTDLLCVLPKYLKNDFKPMFIDLFGSLLK